MAVLLLRRCYSLWNHHPPPTAFGSILGITPDIVNGAGRLGNAFFLSVELKAPSVSHSIPSLSASRPLWPLGWLISVPAIVNSCPSPCLRNIIESAVQEELLWLNLILKWLLRHLGIAVQNIQIQQLLMLQAYNMILKVLKVWVKPLTRHIWCFTF